MAKITYENKVALNENPEIADINKVKDTDMNQIKEAVNTNETKELLEVTDIAPDICNTGDMYFNTTDNLIYTATATNTWGSTGVAPTSNTIYVTFTDNTIYMYDGTTLVSVGGGAGGGGDNEPIGKVVPMVLETAPDGYLLCDGSTYTKAAYPDLYKALVGTSFIVDANNFRVPDIKGKVIVGKDSNDTDFDTLGETGGEKTHTLNINEMPSHRHKDAISVGGSQQLETVQYNGSQSGSQYYVETSVVGGDQPHNILQPYIVLNYFIKAQKLSGDVVLSESLPVGTIVDFDGEESDIPVGWEKVNNVLWTNSNPSDDFSSQDISINNINDFNYFKIVIRNSKTSSVVYTVDYYKTAYTTITAILNDGSNTYFRNFTFDFTNKKIVASQSSIPGVGYHNETNIPLCIIGMNI